MTNAKSLPIQSNAELGYDELKALSEHYSGLERDCLAKVIAMEKAKQPYREMKRGEWDKAVLERAAAMLDGRASQVLQRSTPEPNGLAARILPPAKSAQKDLTDAAIDLAAVRMIRERLTLRVGEAEIVEALDRADHLRPAWGKLVRDWLLKALEFEAAEARAVAFLQRAGLASHGLEMTRWVGRAEVALGGDDMAEVIKCALEVGVVTESEIRKAKNA